MILIQAGAARPLEKFQDSGCLILLPSRTSLALAVGLADFLDRVVFVLVLAAAGATSGACAPCVPASSVG